MELLLKSEGGGAVGPEAGVLWDGGRGAVT